MGDYPNSDEEFELMYGDELELLNQQAEPDNHSKKCRKSLNFTPQLSQNKENDASAYNSQSQDLFADTQPSTSQQISTGSETINSHQDTQTLTTTRILTQIGDSNNKKRSIQELFGDIDDILYGETLEGQLKKHKVDDYALIDQILELRKLAKEQHNPGLKRKDYTSNVDRDKNNLSFRVPKYPFIGVTRSDGERVYVRFHSEEYEKDEVKRVVNEIHCVGVLGDSFKQVWTEAQQLVNREWDRGSVEESASIEVVDSNKKLWVDLYKPRKYVELLSDESTNRTLLKWMKLWDKIVFNRRPKAKPAPKSDEPFKKFQKVELNTDLDDHGRPYHKVALLCGPPGLGKTTLAHMVARHAGYNVVEVNASDDRSTDAFRTALENATQMRSVLDQEGRPNCLIFDEIDGAPQSSIDFLVKFISGAPAKKRTKQTNKTTILKRPIICICNDVYVPALRPLRQVAFVVNFPATSSTRLSERLMEIARRQHVKTDGGAMLALAEKSHNDIRSCLSVLHFFKAQSKPVTLSDVYRASVGQKDMQKGLFAVWGDIFQIQRPNKMAKQEITLRSRMEKILGVVNSFGDYERVTQGVFENYPNMKVNDSTLVETCNALDWFCYTDFINKEIYAKQNYSLMTYLQYAFVVWHFTFASMKWQQLKYPSAGYEAKMKKVRQKATVDEVMKGMQPSIRAFTQPISLILDTLPFLAIIIVPPFRPVNLHLYTKEEKETLDRVVGIMIDYNLNYVQERTAEGSYEFKLDPDIEEIVALGDAKLGRQKSLSYSNKQMIAHEIELVKMRKFERVIEKPPSKKELPNHLQTLKKAVKTSASLKPTVTKDFFGRTVTKAASAEKTGPALKSDILYQYKEGYNNAVRKTIKIASLK